MADQIRFTPVQVFDANGDPAAGAKAYFYQTGTTTPLTTYADEGLTTPHPNPLVADAQGVFAAVFISGGGDAKVDVTDAADVRLNGYPIDPATLHSGGKSAATISFSATAENPNINVQDAIDAVSYPWTTASTAGAALTAIGAQASDADLTDLATNGFATAANYRTAEANKTLKADIVWDAMAEVTLTDAANISWDMDTGIDFVVTLGGSRTLDNPTNVTVGKKGRLRVVQDGTGSRTLAVGTNFAFFGKVAPTLSTAANAVDILGYDCLSATEIIITIGTNLGKP